MKKKDIRAAYLGGYIMVSLKDFNRLAKLAGYNIPIITPGHKRRK